MNPPEAQQLPSTRDLTGSAYGRPKPSYIKELVETDAGTPMGEYMRRYWQPIAISAELKDLPKRMKLFGEDLIVFRDGKGRPGCVLERCTHRQASLFYARIEEEGIRCCYHGWLFDVEGRCVDQAIEEGGGKFRHKVRQPWYPVEERYGLVFVYMGPPDKMPLLPRYSFMEDLKEGEYLSQWWDSLPGSEIGEVPSNWLVDQENITDLAHAAWLHHLHSGPQFGPLFSHITQENIASYELMTDYPESQRGILTRTKMPGPFGSLYLARIETQLPNLRLFQPPIVPGKPTIMNWVLPTDNHNHISMNLAKVTPQNKDMLAFRSELRDDPEWTQRHPSDGQAQENPNGIELHSEEHLAFSDRGLVKMRRMYMQQLEAMKNGKPLKNIVYEPGQEIFDSEGGVDELTPPSFPPGMQPGMRPPGM